MTWKNQEGAPIASLFWEAIFLRLVENVVRNGGKLWRGCPTNLDGILGYQAFIILSVVGN